MQSHTMCALEYSALEKLAVAKPVNRIEYIVEKVRGLHVLDLGALDETAYQIKADTHNWLHKEMAAAASKLVGIDNSALVPVEGLHLFENSEIYLGNITQLNTTFAAHGYPEVIVAGELIEHLPDTLEFLQNLKRDCSATDPLVIITTPNACSCHNAILGLFSRESMHKDHLQIYSYKTLHTMFARAGFREWTIRPYHAKFTEMVQGSTGVKRLATITFEKFINFMERRFPLLGCGWICELRL